MKFIFFKINQKGFTFIELLVVILIISTLAALVLTGYSQGIKKSRLAMGAEEFFSVLQQAQTQVKAGLIEEGSLLCLGAEVNTGGDNFLIKTPSEEGNCVLESVIATLKIELPQNVQVLKVNEETGAISILFAPPLGEIKILGSDGSDFSGADEISIVLSYGGREEEAWTREIVLYPSISKIELF